MIPWLQQVLYILVISALTLVIVRLIKRSAQVIVRGDWLPAAIVIPLSGMLRWVVLVLGVLLILDSLGLPVKSVWAGVLSVVLLVAVAFFAGWSVLSNILCSIVLLAFSRARIGDVVELKDTKRDEVGLRGKIIDINLFYVTLEELEADLAVDEQLPVTQVPCHLFFFRVVRCWRGDKTKPLTAGFGETTPAPSSQVQSVPDNTDAT